MTSSGSPYARFRRALASGNLAMVRAAAAELPVVGLDDALAVCTLMADAEPAKYERAALRWLARFCLERRVTLTDVAQAADALDLLRSEPAAARAELTRLLAGWSSTAVSHFGITRRPDGRLAPPRPHLTHGGRYAPDTLGSALVDLDDPAIAWQLLRRLRPSPPEMASSSGQRRQVFGSALEQAQELGLAATRTGYETKPLLLFYALSQGGRAVAAAFAQGRWKLHTHGLKANTNVATIGEVGVRPKPSDADAFSRLTGALGSPPLAGPTTVAELWASLPGVPDVLPESREALRPLEAAVMGDFVAMPPGRSLRSVPAEDEAAVGAEFAAGGSTPPGD